MHHLLLEMIVAVTRRTLEDIDEEIDDLKQRILGIKKSIHEDEPDWREPWRRKTGDLAPGYVPLAERREEIQVLESKLARLEKKRVALSGKQSQTSGKKFGHGELKAKVEALVKRDGFKVGDTVHSKTIAKWVREIRKEGFDTSEQSIRAALSKMEITKERQIKK